MLEAEDPEAEYQEQPEEEYEVADPVADQDPTLTNFDTYTRRKHVHLD